MRADMDQTPYTCTFCGCLCDDVELVVDADRICDARNACGIGRSRLIGLAVVDSTDPTPSVRGEPATIDDALEVAARILDGLRAPVMVGFERSTNETMRKAVALADRLGATIEVGDARTSWPRISAMQRRGAIGATLGEIKNRADVVVFWGADPVQTHPRHFSRYSVEVQGRFVPDGRAGRKVVVVDQTKTRTAERADLFLELRPDRELETLNTLRALVRGARLDPAGVEAALGVSCADLHALTQVLQGARYGAWFHGALAGRGADEQTEARCEATTALVRELNQTTRFVAVGLGEAGNAHGTESVLAWQSGFAPGVDFSPGFPESLPDETSAFGRISRGWFDGAVVVGGAALNGMAESVRARLEAGPWLFIGDSDHEGAARATVAFPAASAGVDESGTFTRVDGVALPVRAFRKSRARAEGAWLDEIRLAVDQRRTATAAAKGVGGS